MEADRHVGRGGRRGERKEGGIKANRHSGEGVGGNEAGC